MPVIDFRHVTFQHQSSPEILFNDISFQIHTEWRTALVGRNGRGKSTLLQLIGTILHPASGTIESKVRTSLFREREYAADHSVHQVIKQCIAPFDEWEQQMEELLRRGDERSLHRYQELFDHFSEHDGFSIDAAILKECAALGLTEELLHRPYHTVSGGEQTRASIAALFLQRDRFPLMDEPTNHLDMNGREILAEYLSAQKGFVIVSHDRHFLDMCCDHVLAINRNDIRVFSGNYSTWREQLSLEEMTETARMEHIEREISSLERAAQQRRVWSDRKEKEKNSAADSGFVSRKAAKMMKRALSIERRIDERIESKRSLLKNRETIRPLIVHTADRSAEVLLSLEEAEISIGHRVLFDRFSLTVRKRERVALIGPNGCGKSTILNLIRKKLPLLKGNLRIGARSIAHAYQSPLWSEGSLRAFLRNDSIDESRFRTAMGSFDISGEIFDRPLESFSFGERKKVDLCRSFLEPNDLLVWDEPVNYIDIESKEQIEEVILSECPTMLFVEHDRAFVERIATRIIDLNE